MSCGHAPPAWFQDLTVWMPTWVETNCSPPRAAAQGRHGGGRHAYCRAQFHEEQDGARDPEMHQSNKGNQWRVSGTRAADL
ncbi:hypothetical protein Veis_4217 [Verminephrobacter eiseniae EF01-2]|uniref:Uncharacterized protein n=1 Tax=Verminephrobacter eiseniae (strain EF01-2) TaxID=391735 RepID=A1WQL5_VEREI|nr:hypothetical protein Veis_4217 [Verminephrobacter eiseniae EF01-2]